MFNLRFAAIRDDEQVEELNQFLGYLNTLEMVKYEELNDFVQLYIDYYNKHQDSDKGDIAAVKLMAVACRFLPNFLSLSKTLVKLAEEKYKTEVHYEPSRGL